MPVSEQEINNVPKLARSLSLKIIIMKSYAALKYAIKVWFLGLLLSQLCYVILYRGYSFWGDIDIAFIFKTWGDNLTICFPAILIFWEVTRRLLKSKKTDIQIKIYLNISVFLLLITTTYLSFIFNEVNVLERISDIWKEFVAICIMLSALVWFFKLERGEEKVETIDHLIE